jgi:hypothetical protein
VKLLALLALVGVHHADIAPVAHAIQHGPRVVDQATIAAIIEHESHGDTRACREDDGGSSRGLMQLWRPNSKCSPEDDARFAADYEAGSNVRAALRLLVKQRDWHRKHCRHPHDVLEHYAGKGPSAKQFARDIRRRARELRGKKG